MRINPPSLYAAFGDKERLYLGALELYQHRRLGATRKRLLATGAAAMRAWPQRG
jgi:AcrR family transcriptional regulator